MFILARGNDALNVNPPVGVDSALSVNGSDWLWVVMAMHLFAFVSFPVHRVLLTLVH